MNPGEGRADRGEQGARIEAVVSDFGGVLTSPVFDSFVAWQEATGISLEVLGNAMAELAERDGIHPLFELGMSAVWFRETEQAIEEIEAALAA